MHMPDLRFVTRGLDAGAFTGTEALEALMGLRSEHQEEMAARRAAQQDTQGTALDALLTNTLSAAGEPQSPEDAMRVAQATAMFGAGDPAAGTAALFLPQNSGYEGNQGQSRIDPTLRPEDVYDIQRLVAEGVTPETIMAEMANIYGPKTLERLQGEIFEAIGKPSIY